MVFKELFKEEDVRGKDLLSPKRMMLMKKCFCEIRTKRSVEVHGGRKLHLSLSPSAFSHRRERYIQETEVYCEIIVKYDWVEDVCPVPFVPTNCNILGAGSLVTDTY